jgi:hypothetical protein
MKINYGNMILNYLFVLVKKEFLASEINSYKYVDVNNKVDKMRFI